MKRTIAVVLALIMVLAFSATAFAMNRPLSLIQAKQAAPDFAGVKATDATFTKACRSWDDGRKIYEIEFYSNNTEYDMDVDVNTGVITDYSTDYHPGFGTLQTNNSRLNGNNYGYFDNDPYDFDDAFDIYD